MKFSVFLFCHHNASLLRIALCRGSWDRSFSFRSGPCCFPWFLYSHGPLGLEQTDQISDSCITWIALLICVIIIKLLLECSYWTGNPLPCPPRQRRWFGTASVTDRNVFCTLWHILCLCDFVYPCTYIYNKLFINHKIIRLQCNRK